MNTIYSVKPGDLALLGPADAVDLFRDLLWAEATSTGIGKDLVTVPSAITSADGGIDAEVKGAPVTSGQGLIKQGLTRYQIKTGRVSPRNKSDVESILFREGTHELRPRIKTGLDQGGTLIVVLFGWDDPERTDGEYAEAFRGRLKEVDASYANARVEVWVQHKIAGFLQRFTSLALRATNRGHLAFQTYASWSRDAEMTLHFEPGLDLPRFRGRLGT